MCSSSSRLARFASLASLAARCSLLAARCSLLAAHLYRPSQLVPLLDAKHAELAVVHFGALVEPDDGRPVVANVVLHSVAVGGKNSQVAHRAGVSLVH